jgi:hypothetical protein
MLSEVLVYYRYMFDHSGYSERFSPIKEGEVETFTFILRRRLPTDHATV